MRPENLFALDLGTTKFSIASFMPTASTGHHGIYTVSQRAEGMHRGMLANLKEAEACLSDLIQVAQRKFNTSIDKVVLGVDNISQLKQNIKVAKSKLTSTELEIIDSELAEIKIPTELLIPSNWK